MKRGTIVRLVAVFAAASLLAGCSSTSPVPEETGLPSFQTPPAVMIEATRAQREKELAAARAAYEKNPGDADAIIWLGRRTAYLGRYAEAVAIYTEGTKKHPRDARMLRHRGHRWITLRELDRAVADLERAASLVSGRPDEIEPDGLPNARNIPTSTLHSNIWYHLGLARYLRGDLDGALDAYRRCLALSRNPDGVVSSSYWVYSILRRLGRTAEAEKVLEAISTDMDVIENVAYHKLLLMAKGEIDPSELVSQDPSTVDGATILYGVGNWFFYNGQAERAKTLFEKVTAGPQWASFGFIAAEADLRRM